MNVITGTLLIIRIYGICRSEDSFKSADIKDGWNILIYSFLRILKLSQRFPAILSYQI